MFKNRLFLKNIMWLFILILPFTVFAQVSIPKPQEVIRINIQFVDSLTKKGIDKIMLTDFKNSRYYFTDGAGKFNITLLKNTTNDTLFIERQNYKPKKITYKQLSKLKQVNLQAIAKKQQQQAIKATKNITLNDFNGTDLNHFVGLPNDFISFSYLQIAQKFENPYDQMLLKKIKIGHLFFYQPMWAQGDSLRRTESSVEKTIAPDARPEINRTFSYSYLQRCKFKIRIYSCDSITNLPAADLYENEIIVDKEDNAIIVDVKKYSIVVPKGKFFIAVEWLREEENLSYVYFPNINQLFFSKAFKPYVGIINTKGNTLNAFVKDFNGNWKPYTYLEPDFTDLAIALEADY